MKKTKVTKSEKIDLSVCTYDDNDIDPVTKAINRQVAAVIDESCRHSIFKPGQIWIVHNYNTVVRCSFPVGTMGWIKIEEKSWTFR